MYELLYIVPAIYAEDELKKVTAKIDGLLKARRRGNRKIGNRGEASLGLSD